MKKNLALLVVLAVTIPLMAQKNFEWKKISDKSDGSEFNGFFHVSDNDYKAVFEVPGKKNGAKKTSDIVIRTYTNDLGKYTEASIPPESPLEFSVRSFNNYTVFYGSRDENNAPVEAGKYKRDNQVLFTDAQLNPLKNVLFPLHQAKRNFNGIPSVDISYDNNYLIIVNSEILNAMAPKDNKLLKHYISVYDKDLQLVWNDSVNFLDILKQKKEPDDVYFDFIKGKLYIMGSNNGIPQKNIKPDLYVLQYDKPQSYKLIFDQTFKHNSLGWEYLVTNDGFMIINGTNIAYNSPYVNGILGSIGVNANPEKDLFYAKLDLNSQDAAPLFINTDINKQFVEKYPEYRSDLSDFISFPTDILLMNDGVLFCSEYHQQVTQRENNMTTTSVHNRAITLIKYDFSGNIEWIKMIDKHIFSEKIFEGYFCKPFIIGNDILILYYDIEKNITSDKLKYPFFALDNNYCLVTARIDPGGDIKKTLIYKVGDCDNIYSYLPNVKQIDANRFFLLGLEVQNKVVTFGNTGPIKKFKGAYAGIFSLRK